jgi:hypothetical protein
VITETIITPLRLVFWGGLICLFDLNFSQTTNGRGFIFDVLNDAVGMILISTGVFRLGSCQVNDRYEKVMLFVKVVAVLATLDAFRAHIITPLPAAVSFVLHILGIANLAAIIAFCYSMKWLSSSTRLTASESSWRTTTMLFIFIYAVPLGIVHLMGAASIVTGTSFSFNMGPAGLLLLPVFAIPIVHLFVSTSRMQREAESGDKSFDEWAGTPGSDHR